MRPGLDRRTVRMGCRPHPARARRTPRLAGTDHPWRVGFSPPRDGGNAGLPAMAQPLCRSREIDGRRRRMTAIAPLPQEFGAHLGQNTHPGLLLDKFVESWDAGGSRRKAFGTRAETSVGGGRRPVATAAAGFGSGRPLRPSRTDARVACRHVHHCVSHLRSSDPSLGAGVGPGKCRDLPASAVRIRLPARDGAEGHGAGLCGDGRGQRVQTRLRQFSARPRIRARSSSMMLGLSIGPS